MKCPQNDSHKITSIARIERERERGCLVDTQTTQASTGSNKTATTPKKTYQRTQTQQQEQQHTTTTPTVHQPINPSNNNENRHLSVLDKPQITNNLFIPFHSIPLNHATARRRDCRQPHIAQPHQSRRGEPKDGRHVQSSTSQTKASQYSQDSLPASPWKCQHSIQQ